MLTLVVDLGPHAGTATRFSSDLCQTTVALDLVGLCSGVPAHRAARGVTFSVCGSMSMWRAELSKGKPSRSRGLDSTNTHCLRRGVG